MEVMTGIKQVFVDLNMVRGLKKNQVVEVISKGKTTTRMKNIMIGIIKAGSSTHADWNCH